MYLFTKDQIELKAYTAGYIDCTIEPFIKDEVYNKFPIEIMEKLWKDGFFKLCIDESYDGLNLDAVSSLIIIQALSRCSGSIGHIVAGINYGIYKVIDLYGTYKQKETYLGYCGDTPNIGALAFNEPDGAGINQIATVAMKENGKYKLVGTKSLITNGAHATFALVLAQVICKGEKQGYAVFVVDIKNNKNVIVGKPEVTMGLKLVETTDLFFDDVILEEKDILGKEDNGFQVLAGAMNFMRLGNAAVALGIAERAFEECKLFCSQRSISGQPMVQMNVIKNKFAEMHADIKIMNTMLYYCASKIEEMDIANVSIVKAFITEKAKEVCDKCMQLFGGNGYVTGSIIERLYRDIRVMTIMGGSTETIIDMVVSEVFEAVS